MTLEEAIAYADRGIERARQLGLKLSFAVVDEFGQLVQLDRMDGASLVSPDIAEAKAVTAANFQIPTTDVARLDAPALRTIEQLSYFKIVTLPGGVPIFKNGVLQGAIGVSGGTGAQEEQVANYVAARG